MRSRVQSSPGLASLLDWTRRSRDALENRRHDATARDENSKIAQFSESLKLGYRNATRDLRANRFGVLFYRPIRLFSASRAAAPTLVEMCTRCRKMLIDRDAVCRRPLARARRDIEQSHRRGFAARSARRGRQRRRVRGVRVATLRVVYGSTLRIQRP